MGLMLIQPHWNNVVSSQRPVTPRDYIRASEIGMPFVDRYLALKGEQISNPFSPRVLRIFEAGRVIEYIVLRVLAQVGILHKKQVAVELPETNDHLRVSGRLDATIGGFVDWDAALTKVRQNIEEYSFDLDDDLVESKAVAIIDGLRREYPKGWPEEMVVEVKSINSRAFFAHKNRDAQGNFLGYDHNKLQLFAYLKMTGLRQGILLYVSKDDFTIEEIGVIHTDRKLEEAFYSDIHTISRYYWDDEMPPREPEIVYNDRKGVFEVNWNVARSLYLTRIYGYENADAFERAKHQEILDINRALRHLRDGKLKKEDYAVIKEYGLEQYK